MKTSKRPQGFTLVPPDVSVARINFANSRWHIIFITTPKMHSRQEAGVLIGLVTQTQDSVRPNPEAGHFRSFHLLSREIFSIP